MSKKANDKETGTDVTTTAPVNYLFPTDGTDVYPAGSSWTFFVPPGWLFAGTVIGSMGSGQDTILVLKDAVYLESVAQGKTNIGDLAMAMTTSEQLEICTQSYQLPDGFRIRADAILVASPHKISVRGLAYRKSIGALKGAK